jgi:dihydroorotase-like cyclic amidohydrolase
LPLGPSTNLLSQALKAPISHLLAASLNSRSVHISDMQNKEDLLLIKLSKAKGLKVMCDISTQHLYPILHEGPVRYGCEGTPNNE